MEIKKSHKVMKEVEVIDERYTQCDKCGDRIKIGGYDAFCCELEHKTGSSYPEGGSGDIDTLDLCQDCAKDLIKLLKENEYNVQSKEWDW